MAIGVFFGRQRRFISRRLTYAVPVLIALVYAIITVLTPTIVPVTAPGNAIKQDASHKIKSSVSGLRDSLDRGVKELNPFKGPTHAPPIRVQDSFQDTSWWADWKWLSVPLSSSLTLDDGRALLPPLHDRPFVYCYYDATMKTREEKDAESKLLVTWRRAWWAQGFNPTILGPSEAMTNPKYQELHRLELQPKLEKDLLRWLTWESTGTGFLVGHTLFPVANAQDPLLVFLRRDKYPVVTNWKGLGDALIVGAKEDITDIIRKLIYSPTLKTSRSVFQGSAKNNSRIDRAQTSLVNYSLEAIEKQYLNVHDSLINARAKGLGALNRLINDHLHAAWQSGFPDGIEVLSPFSEYTLEMVSPALQLANSLALCPDNPIPTSCPPGVSRCTY